ncbi:mannose-6-phosphate isomerase, class I [Stackebrandtia nassauensis]|uniref:mannose-6-phosphate isomerase, class I n=1 Tax=Stackebrandtia nassauensis TaxID=283811 RepID=UPI0003161103
MELLNGAIRPYAWGSRTAIAALQGRSMPSSTPEAELWFGAHPADPSRLPDGRDLNEAIAKAPEALLGAETVAEFGARLPYLLKVLAAEQPLSLQAHPDADQAIEGFTREDEAGVPLGTPERNYVDAFHKPELLCAVSEFEALCGFRDPQLSAEVIETLGVPGLESIVALLRQDDAAQGLREAVTTLLTLPADHREELVRQATLSAERLADTDSPHAFDFALVADLGKRYPSDAGTIVALLLHHITLQPGQAIYMPAGNLHAYLRGVGVELMAASDNVLRGGLTGKHVDVPELLRVLRFEVLGDPISPAREAGGGIVDWPVPSREFRLSRLRLEADSGQRTLPVNGPSIILCWSGQIRLDDGVSPITLQPGQAAFAPADTPTIYASGFGDSYCAGLGTGH